MLTPLSVPSEIRTVTGDDGEPAAVVLKDRRRPVVSIRNRWRIDDEWWREEIARQYFELEMDNGLVVTVFHDLVSGKWYRQRY